MPHVDPKFRALIPPLDPTERQILETSILAEGCRDAIVVWQERDVIIDGHNRWDICQEHGLDAPTRTLSFTDEHEVVEWMCVNQLGRRNLSDTARSDLRGKRYNNQKQMQGGDRRSSAHNEHMNGRTADSIAAQDNVSGITVRRDAEFSAALDTLADMGVDRQDITSGKRKVKKNAVVALAKLAEHNPDAARAAWDRVVAEGDTAGSIKAAMRDVRNSAAASAIADTSDDLVELHLGDFAELTADLEPGSVDAIITDPPYPAEFLPEWDKLGATAMRLLKPGGWCIAYSGKQHLDVVMRKMTDAGLNYYWQLVFQQTVSATIHPRKVNTTYKPILMFQKPPITPPETYFSDTIKGERVEKDGHEWQQSENGFAWLIEKFTNVGDLIIEPFSGAGTCPVVARRLSRRCYAYEIDPQAFAASQARLWGTP
jgi:16S rRNA G966 N2-methylase RsmD